MCLCPCVCACVRVCVRVCVRDYVVCVHIYKCFLAFCTCTHTIQCAHPEMIAGHEGTNSFEVTSQALATAIARSTTANEVCGDRLRRRNDAACSSPLSAILGGVVLVHDLALLHGRHTVVPPPLPEHTHIRTHGCNLTNLTSLLSVF